MVKRAEVVVLGAGPYGLAATAHLRRAGVDVAIFGDPMSFWRTMPLGMLLRSNWTATCIAEYNGRLSLDEYQAKTGRRFGRPVPLEDFVDYGLWVQGLVAPDVDKRAVASAAASSDGFTITLEDGEIVRAKRFVIAAGIGPFARTPSKLRQLDVELSSHTSEHRDLADFSGKRVLVVGGGQSALESAALLHENGADVEVIARKSQLIWLHGGKYHRMLGRLAPMVYAPTDVGPMGLSRLVAVPNMFRRIPRGLQDSIARRAIRPAGAEWLVDRLAGVPIRLGHEIQSAKPDNGGVHIELDDGQVLQADHVLCGTGYQVDIAKYPFISRELLDNIRRVNGYPVLRRGLESTVPGLHFLGAPAARSFGPIMRFVSGGWFAARSLTRVVTA